MLWRGTLLLLVGQIVFLVCGYGINVVLARLLDPEGYGTFGVVYSILMIFELFVVAGIPNALQRFVGENPDRAYVLHKVMLRGQLVYTVSVFVLAIIAAPAIAKFLQDRQLAAILQIAAIDILFFSFYWYYNGLQIGLKNFGKQAVIASTYSLTKFGFIFFLVDAGFSVRGAFVGNLLGSICGLVLGIWFLRLRKQDANYSQKDVTQFIVANILYTIGLNLFFYIDLWFVKYHLSESTVGHYNAASTLCRIPYFFSIALSGALLPSLSSAIAQSRTHEVERLIRQSLRLIILLVLPTMVVVATTALPVVLLLFGEKYTGAATIAQRLIVGMTFFTVFTVTNTI
ncbi:MAG: oligosaccharide flippase family protein, partial [candidate division KSB1 bacterium]|nr:oligosaccharide flippase family protein [candidate division KSB1 bacterium]